jgi:hypothetical protein
MKRFRTLFLMLAVAAGFVLVLASPLQVSAQPKLAISFSNGNAYVSWPTNYTGYTLVYTFSLAPPVSWQTAPSKPTVVNGQWTMTIPVTISPQTFFELEPPPQLAMSFSAGGTANVTWPTNYVGYTLFYTFSLTPPVSGQPAPVRPTVVNGRWSIPVPVIISPQTFFELQR